MGAGNSNCFPPPWPQEVLRRSRRAIRFYSLTLSEERRNRFLLPICLREVYRCFGVMKARNLRRKVPRAYVWSKVAEREGFEPPLGFPPELISSQPPSASRPSLRSVGFGREKTITVSSKSQELCDGRMCFSVINPLSVGGLCRQFLTLGG